MKVKKRKKTSRLRGSRTAFYGNRKKHRGSGHRGGVGMAGTGKRADQKKTKVLKEYEQYFGKQGFTSRKTRTKKDNKCINIRNIIENLENYRKKDIVKETKEGIEVNMKKFKIIGSIELKKKFFFKARAYSKSAKESIEKAGGKAE